MYKKIHRVWPEGRTNFQLIRMARQYVSALALVIIFVPELLVASTPEAGDLSFVCDQVAGLAAAQSGVPISVLKAIALTETGRNRGGVMRPWPWTVNMEGKGVWFDNEEEALAFVHQHYNRGARSFDIGCFQINYRWHHQHFSSIEEMFDPVANALYAARFLKELFDEKGNWHEAAGAYHSRTPKFANRYKERFAIFRAKFLHEDGLPLQIASAPPAQHEPIEVTPSRVPIRQIVPRVNNFPLLQVGRGGNSMGSLVPLSGSSGARNLLAESADNG